MNVLLAFIHFSVLAFLLGRNLRGKNFSPIEHALITAMLIWLDLILAGYTLSVFSALNNFGLWALLTIIYAAAASALIRRTAPLPPADLHDAQSSPAPSLFQRILIHFFLWTAAAALLCNLFIAFRIAPNNADTLAYRIPRAFFYLSHGSFFHFVTGVDPGLTSAPLDGIMHSALSDPRLTSYPLNSVMLHAFGIHHQLGPVAITLASCLAWVCVGLALYRLCRNLGTSQVGSIGTAWIICFTPNVLIQATSTNDEILAAAPLVIAMLMAKHWLQSRATSHLLPAGIGVGISLGTKLHLFFFWPAIVAFALAGAVYCYMRRETAWETAKPMVFPVVLAGIIAGTISLPFAAINVAQTGHITNPQWTEMISNTPFRTAVGVQTATLYLAQLFINPVGDLYINTAVNNDDDKRRDYYARANTYVNELLFSWVNRSSDYMRSYKFQGMWCTYSYYQAEESVFLGFTPWLFVAGLLCLHLTPGVAIGRRILMAMLMVLFWTYIITYGMLTRYVETVGIYFAYAAIVGGAGPAILWFPSRTKLVNGLKAGLLGFVIITNVIFTINIYRGNVWRNIIIASQPNAFLYNRGIDARAVRELQGAEKIQLVFTHWEPAFYSLMMMNPRLIYTTGDKPASIEPNVLYICSYQATPMWGQIPLRIYDDNKSRKALTYLGLHHSCYGLEYTFACGNNVDQRYHEDSGYVILHSSIEKTATSFIVKIAPKVEALAATDRPRYRYALMSGSNVLRQREWSSEAAAVLTTDVPAPADCILSVEVELDGKIHQLSFPLTGAEPLLKERS